MENKTSKRIKLLVAAVLVLFLAMTVMEIAPDFLSGFRDGCKSGTEEANAVWDSGDTSVSPLRHMFATIEPDNPDAPLLVFADGVEVRPNETFAEITVPATAPGSGWVMANIVKVLFGLAALVASVVFTVHLVLFAVRFPRRPILSRGNIVSMRWIAASLGVFGLAIYGFAAIDYFWLRTNVALEGWSITIDPPPSAIIVAAILLVMTEILNLAGKLQQEQDLTI